MKRDGFCDGIKRRDFLKVGALAGGAFSGLGLNLAGYLRMASAGALARPKATSAIYIRLAGGPSHMDTFDLKPGASSEYRGEFNPIDTRVAGIQISEHLPKLAECADKYTILRGVSHTLAAHQLGTEYMNTGNRPLPSLQYPGFGAVVAKELPGSAEVPPFVAIPDTPQSGGYLGIRYGAFSTNAQPRMGAPFKVRGMAMDDGLTISDIDRRQQLLQRVDRAFAGYERNDALLSGLDEFSERAHSMLSSPKAREAFDTGREKSEVAERFGESGFGQSCLLAVRLIEAGVRFATVSSGGWDNHQNIFSILKDNNLPDLDAGLAGLFTTLAERGLLESTAVFISGEFGRTPKINTRGGRDHWPRAMFVLLGGGGFKGGAVLGASDENGMGPADKAITPDDIAASFYQALGIDHHKEYQTSTGRPVMIVRDGHVMPELFA